MKKILVGVWVIGLSLLNASFFSIKEWEFYVFILLIGIGGAVFLSMKNPFRLGMEVKRQGDSITGPTGPPRAASTLVGPIGPPRAASTVVGPTGPTGPPEVVLKKVFDPDGNVSEFVIDVKSLTNMGNYDLPDCHLDVYRTAKGGIVLHKHNPVTKLWSYYLPSEKEKEIFANALIDCSDLTEL